MTRLAGRTGLGAIALIGLLCVGAALGIVLVAHERGDAGAATRATPPESNVGSVLFASNRDGDTFSYAVNPDGTGLTRLMRSGGAPVPSPDGSRIVDGLYVMDADGTNRRALRGCEGLSFGWSPDSSRLACEASGAAGIAVADVASGKTTFLTQRADAPSWSPDGRLIAFTDDRGLWVMNADGTSRRFLVRAARGLPSWSPDSRTLAYARLKLSNYHTDLYTIGVDGTGARKLVEDFVNGSANWSPTGSVIAFSKGDNIYTIRGDGSDLRLVSAKASEPSWSADGSELLYTTGRFPGGEESDIVIAKVGRRHGRRLTHPFPQGGSNFHPLWLSGTRQSGGEPTPERVALPLTRQITFADPIQSLTADGPRAVARLKPGARNELAVWDAAARGLSSVPLPCDADAGPLGEIALAGDHLALTCIHYYAMGDTEDFHLRMERLGEGTSSAVAGNCTGTEQVGGLVGRDDTIVFASFAGRSPNARILSPPSCRLLTAAAGGVPTAVDGERVVTVERGGLVTLLTTRNMVLRTWKLGRGVITARLRGNRLAVQVRTTLDVFDVRSGRRTKTLRLAGDEGVRSAPPLPLPQFGPSRAFLLDVQGNFAAYATGGAIHLVRLSDGRDVALEIPGAAPPLDARLEPSGLFLSWNQMHSRRPGRLAFVPLRALRP